ncbi:MAG TPA: isoprenylcysteine carboxylmethyltransferase family protein [Candidatus Nitrosotenuis sp.]|nr:isoprenylcysteine carboxylmethyltransferase family protein [Candidatus Nitrosotenuis sp.]
MKKALALLYGVVCYLFFFGTFLYAIWFVWKMDDAAEISPWPQNVLINAGLLALFALQHSVMARQWFKRAWTKIVAPPVERSTYVLCASAALFLLVYFWQPLPKEIWRVENEIARWVLIGLFWLGWGIVLFSTYMIDHFDLFGLKQAWLYWKGREYEPPKFATPGLYKWVRHPLYLGFLIAFWCAPTMTAGHLFFAVMTTAYILLAIQFEERDLENIHGEAYRVYRSGVSMLTPWPRKRPPA